MTSTITDRDLYRYGTTLEPPGFVKEASGHQLTGGDGLSRGYYADPNSQSYPTHTAASTWISWAKFAEDRAQLPIQQAQAIERRLHKAAAHFRIEADVEAMKRRMADQAADPEPQTGRDDFAWLDTDGHGHLPLRNHEEVKQASAYVVRYRDRLAHGDAAVMAHRILSKAAGLQTILDEDHEAALERLAGFGVSPIRLQVEAVVKRASLLRAKQPTYATALDDIAAELRQGALRPGNRDGLMKLAGILDDIDDQFKLRSRDEQLGYPEDALFAVTPKAATSASAMVELTTGAIYHEEDLLRAQLGDGFGEKVASACAPAGLFADRDGSALQVLPRGEAQRLETKLASQGIRPAMRVQTGRTYPRSRLIELAVQAERPR